MINLEAEKILAHHFSALFGILAWLAEKEEISLKERQEESLSPKVYRQVSKGQLHHLIQRLWQSEDSCTFSSLLRPCPLPPPYHIYTSRGNLELWILVKPNLKMRPSNLPAPLYYLYTPFIMENFWSRWKRTLLKVLHCFGQYGTPAILHYESLLKCQLYY